MESKRIVVFIVNKVESMEQLVLVSTPPGCRWAGGGERHIQIDMHILDYEQGATSRNWEQEAEANSIMTYITQNVRRSLFRIFVSQSLRVGGKN